MPAAPLFSSNEDGRCRQECCRFCIVAVARMLQKLQRSPWPGRSAARREPRASLPPARGEASCPHPGRTAPDATRRRWPSAGGRHTDTHADRGRGFEIDVPARRAIWKRSTKQTVSRRMVASAASTSRNEASWRRRKQRHAGRQDDRCHDPGVRNLRRAGKRASRILYLPR